MKPQRAATHSPISGRPARRRPVPRGAAAVAAGGSGHPSAQDRGQREHLLAAAGQLARALLAGEQIHDVLQLTVTQARQGTMAALALIGASTDGDLLVVEAAVGPDSDRLPGRSIRLTALPAEALTSLPGCTPSFTKLPRPAHLSLPLGRTPWGGRRILVVLGLPAARRAAATRALRGFADQVAEALELADKRVAVERERLLQDRDRTASALQEFVIPHLFATGLRLAGADGLIHDQPNQARARLCQAVDDLDTAIAEVRTAALGLRTAPTGPADTAGACPETTL